MNGFHIVAEAEGINRIENRAGQFLLKAFDDTIEMFQVDVYAGKSILCQPKDCVGNINACLVLKGRLQHQTTQTVLHPGDMYTFKDITDTHYLSVLEDSKLIMIAQRGHLFNKMDRLNVFTEQMDKIQDTDHYTGSHCDRTGTLAAKIASRLKLSETQIENILYAGKIHDIGKINVPDFILNKPSSLTDLEFEKMKTHTNHGHAIVTSELDDPIIADIILNHHERLDGSGYPKGLCGDEIRIESQIIAVVDIYDAMTTDRPYRKAFSQEYALDELKRLRETKYDAAIIDALIELVTGSDIG